MLVQALAMATRSGCMDAVARAHLSLGVAAYLDGNHQEALCRGAGSLREYARIGHWSGVAGTLEGLAVLAMAGGDAIRTLRLGGAAAAIRRRIGSAPARGWQDMVDSVGFAPARALTGAYAEEAWADGERLSVPEAIEYALGT